MEAVLQKLAANVSGHYYFPVYVCSWVVKSKKPTAVRQWVEESW
jgi:hypothetical protein